MGQVSERRFRKGGSKVRGSQDPPPIVTPVTLVSVNDVVRSIYHDGVLPPRQSGSIYVANEVQMQTLHATSGSPRDWERGSALHADARPDPVGGAPYHGAPWDWTINGVLVSTYQWHNIWHELTAYSKTGLPHGVRVQYRNIKAWILDAAKTTWTQTLGDGASGSYQTSAGPPRGGYFHSTPDYAKEADINGWTTSGTTVNGYVYPASPGSKWRTESDANGGGWSISLDPMIDSSGNLIDDLGICHGPFTNTNSPDRIKIPTGGYMAHSGEMRLIMDDYSAVPSSAKYTATIGVDIFTAQLASQDPSTARNTSNCNPRHRIVPRDGSWQWVGHCSGSAAMIRSFPALPFVNA